MKNWNRSEIIAVAVLVAVILGLAYIGINAEKDLVGKADTAAADRLRRAVDLVVAASEDSIPDDDAPAAPSTSGGSSSVEVYVPPAAPTAGASGALPGPGTGTTGLTVPNGYHPFLEDKDKDSVIDTGERYIMIPFGKGRVKKWEGDTLTVSQKGDNSQTLLWTVSNNGQTLTAKDESGTYVYDYRGKNSIYRATDQSGKVTAVSIHADGKWNNVPKEMSPLITLDPHKDYLVAGPDADNIVTVTERSTVGGVTRTHVLSYYPNLKTTEDVTVITGSAAAGAAPITRTTIVTQLGEDGNGGTATWSGTTIEQPGTLVIKDAQGETFNLDGMVFDDYTFANVDKTKSFDIERQKLTEGASGGAHTETSFAKNDFGAAAGDRTIQKFNDKKKGTSREIYHVGGDFSKTDFDKDGAAVSTTRVAEQRAGIAGPLVFVSYHKTGNTYRPVSALLHDTNRDQKVDRADALKLGVSDVLFSQADKDKNGEIDRTEMQGILNEQSNTIYSHDDIDNDRVPDDIKAELNGADDKNQYRRYITGQSDAAVVGDFLANYNSKQGISNLLFGKAFLNEWREEVDEAFARTYLGVDYWTSEICSDEFDVVGESVVGIEAAEGVFQFIGTAQAEVAGSVPMLCDANKECKAGTCRRRDNACVDSNDKVILEHFYKITYGVRAPTDERFTPYYDEDGVISFNIVVQGKARTASLFTQFVNLESGENAANKAPKPSPILHYSPNIYDEVCLVFGKKPVDRKGKDVRNICNPIVQATGSFENFRRSSDAPSAFGSEPLFNTDW